ncbi:SDR family NAD(P)-dependent oxidoreductase [Variovorax sp. VNK109]|uniref:SDR family NAD(P)-dependent oxidoreductase n=1 Tax=Variovorax sp. VNK109 TaxID=3400919 RepID=UPI003C076D58
MHNQHLYILTGASRGMGLAIAQQLVQPGHVILGISRRSNNTLASQAASANVKLEQWEQDLALGEAASARLSAWLSTQDAKAFTSATLINNAGVIPRIAPLADSDAADLANALRVGLEAPMLMSAAFLHATKDWPAARRVLNISSGLGRRAMASQSAYCAAKAGMDHFTRCLALDEAATPNGAKVCSLAPGVIDTDMQEQLRGADADAFPDRANFVNLKTQGSLTSAEDAAARILKFLARPDFGQNPVADVRDA